MINLFVAKDDNNIYKKFQDYLTKTFSNIISINIILHIQKKGQPTTQDIISTWGKSHLSETLGTMNYLISPLSFFQTNSKQAETLYNTIKQVADLKKTDILLDLYCGAGTIGLYLANDVKHVIGIEENPYAIDDAHRNAKLNHITNATFKCGRVKNILKFETFNPDCIIIDPPRSGMVPKALKRICEMKCKKIIYVSCHPVTLLRDLKLIQEYTYEIKQLIPVDMFPNTYHIECIVELKLK